MKPMCVSLLAVLLLSLLLSSQLVAAQLNTTVASAPNITATENYTGGKNAAERTGGLTLLLPIVLGVSLLHSWSQ